MALANTAVVLASGLAEGQRILAIDWDLEAPGLHRFFRSQFQKSLKNRLYVSDNVSSDPIT